MQENKLWLKCFFFCLFPLLLSSCVSTHSNSVTASANENPLNLPLYHGDVPYSSSYNEGKYALAVPQHISMGQEKVIIVNPRAHSWGAYNADGNLVRAGIANAGADYCKDDGHACRTTTGKFRIFSMGDVDCISKTYPRPEGGSLMPFCMFFNEGQSLHGTPDKMLVDANISHGCVHMRIPDAEWLRYNFATEGTRVVVMPY